MRRTALLLIILAPGCGDTRLTEPSRTATQQMLVSVAAESAAGQIAVETLDDKLVYLDPIGLQGSTLNEADRQHLIAAVRAKLLEGGVRLTHDFEQADIVVEMRSGGLSIDRYHFFVGVPAGVLGPAVAGAGGGNMGMLQKDITLAARDRQWGFGGVSLVAWRRTTGELVTFAGPEIGRSHVERWRLLILGGRTVSDVPTTRQPTQ